MLYDRDYRKLTEDEIKQWQIADNKYGIQMRNLKFVDLVGYYKDLPKAVVYYQTLFPNNYLNTDELYDIQRIKQLKQEFTTRLDDGADERELLNFIRDNQAYLIVASILNPYFNFGHHEAYIFREFMLSTNYKVDFLLIGKNSGGYEFVFIELESVVRNITTKYGEFGASVRKGLKQIDDWNIWIESNFSSLRSEFHRYIGVGNLPKEFYELDKSRIHFALIAGRREDFVERTYYLRRRKRIECNIQILHYDNLLDSIDDLIKDKNY